ncbi:hypothetical protein FRB90_004687 [Tulasnella sp. 427]|nr:hypothetical protein FRB90_004687 [Tulasnella sp. 427]
MPPSLDKIIYESANVLQRKASSDEEVVAKIKALDPLTEVCIRKLPYEKSDPTNPVWRAIRDSGIIGLLLDFATTGKKGDGSFAIMNATNRLRIFCLGQLYEIIVRLELLLDYNEELVDDLVERVPRILEIFELAIQDRDPPGRLALLRLPLLFIVGALAAPRTIDIIDEQYKLLQSNCDTMSWLVFAPLFNDRSALVGIDSFRVTMALGILRSYDGLCINPTTDIIDEAISRYGLVEIRTLAFTDH